MVLHAHTVVVCVGGMEVDRKEGWRGTTAKRSITEVHFADILTGVMLDNSLRDCSSAVDRGGEEPCETFDLGRH